MISMESVTWFCFKTLPLITTKAWISTFGKFAVARGQGISYNMICTHNTLNLFPHFSTKPRYEYSYIESAAIRIGDDIFQVGSYGEHWLNGVESAKLPSVVGEKYTLAQVEANKKHHKYVITLDESTGEAIVIRTFKDLVSVTVENATHANFGGSHGMMGGFDYYGELLGRDGATIMEDASLFGQEWQVTPSDPQLFQSASNSTGVCAPPLVTEESRRLGEGVEKEAAELACAHLDEKMRDMCVFDVIAMSDLEVADAGAF